VVGLALLSSTCIALDEWLPHLHRLRGLPALVTHGRSDDELSFSAGERLRDVLLMAGAEVTWLPFEGGHEMPLVVWRALRRFVLALMPPPAGTPNLGG
jgi:phospholipase/carboxylesterase